MLKNIIVLLTLTTPIVKSLSDQLILELLKHNPVPMKSPVIFYPKGSVDLLKSLTKCDNFGSVKLVKSVPRQKIPRADQNQPLIFIIDDNFDAAVLDKQIQNSDLGIKNSVLILCYKNVLNPKIQNPKFKNIKINQEIYILTLEDLALFESYRINDLVMNFKIGEYIQHGEKIGFQFEYSQGWSYEIGKRRSDFGGKHFKIMTEHEPPSFKLKSSYKKSARFFEANQTYEVTNFASGMYYDVLLNLAKNLNFTYTLYKRKDGVFGGVNGRFEIIFWRQLS